MSEADKAPWDKKAAEDKKRYTTEMASYDGPMPVRKSKGSKGKDGKPKKEKDPNAPKRPQSGYFMWLNANRAAIIQKAGLTPKDVTKVASAAGAQWKTMSEADKAPWDKKAAEDKKRYATEMASYDA